VDYIKDYLKAEYWYLREAVILLFDGTPIIDDGIVSAEDMPPLEGKGTTNPMEEAYDLALRALDTGRLRFIGRRELGWVAPADFRDWAIAMDYPIPEAWKQAPLAEFRTLPPEAYNRLMDEDEEIQIEHQAEGDVLPGEVVGVLNGEPNPGRIESSEQESLPDNGAGTQNQRQETNPDELLVIVDDINENVTVVTQRGQGKKTVYKRRDIFGKGTATWYLLVDFAKCKGSLEGNHSKDVKKRNTSGNRQNLSKKLVEKLRLSKPPIIAGRKGVMCFFSIHLKGSTASTDALDRQTVAHRETITSEEQVAEAIEMANDMLANHGEEVPPVN
jgi:hypothetical protein